MKYLILNLISFGMTASVLICWFVLYQERLESLYAWLCLISLLPFIAALWLMVVLLSALLRRRWGHWRTLALCSALTALPSGLWNVQIGLFTFPLSEEGRSHLSVRVPMDEEMIVLGGGDKVSQNHHAFYPDQRWAYDLVVAPAGHQAKKLEEYGCYGKSVFAPTGGVVHKVIADQPDQPAGVYIPNYQNPVGNAVWIAPAQGGYLVIAHLQAGSVTVQQGQKIKEGIVIGKCGNSGNSSEPHIHIHYQEHDPHEYPINFALGNPLSFHQQQGPARPVGGGHLEEERFILTGDRIKHLP